MDRRSYIDMPNSSVGNAGFPKFGTPRQGRQGSLGCRSSVRRGCVKTRLYTDSASQTEPSHLMCSGMQHGSGRRHDMRRAHFHAIRRHALLGTNLSRSFCGESLRIHRNVGRRGVRHRTSICRSRIGLHPVSGSVRPRNRRHRSYCPRWSQAAWRTSRKPPGTSVRFLFRR